MKISIIIPVYNEFRTFAQVLERVRQAPLPDGCSKEIIAIDDGSTDGTTAVVGNQSRAGVIRAHRFESNSGKGAAIRAGISMASGDVVLIQDGDLEYDPKDYARILEPIIRGEADVVYGSRFLGGAKNLALKYRLANRFLTFATNLLYRAELTDEATAYKAFRATIFNELQLRCRRFEFCPEVTAKLLRLHYNIAEVPISYNPRGIAEGKKIRLKDGLEALWALLKYRFVPARKFTQTPGVQMLVTRSSFS
jgi:glycosyltransferase involved in cell wall biosynthesis